MKKIFDWLGGGLVKEIGGILDGFITTKEEKLEIEAKIKDAILKSALESEAIRAAIITEEAKGNFLQRSWRPILMLAFGFVILFKYALYPVVKAFNPELPEIPEFTGDFWTLLHIGIGGYIGLRTLEKKKLPGITLNKK